MKKLSIFVSFLHFGIFFFKNITQNFNFLIIFPQKFDRRQQKSAVVRPAVARSRCSKNMYFFLFSSKIYIAILVPILIVFPAAGFLLYYQRDRINKARKKCCACILHSNADKDGAKVEDANGEFSHEMQIKSENEYDVTSSDWVSLLF